MNQGGKAEDISQDKGEWIQRVLHRNEEQVGENDPLKRPFLDAAVVQQLGILPIDIEPGAK